VLLPTSWSCLLLLTIHPVFHVSQLKAVVLDPSQVLPTLPDDLSGPGVPQRFLQRRFISRGVEAHQQVLVQWSNWPPELATWEDLDYMKQIFPYAPAWGQAAFQGGRLGLHEADFPVCACLGARRGECDGNNSGAC